MKRYDGDVPAGMLYECLEDGKWCLFSEADSEIRRLREKTKKAAYYLKPGTGTTKAEVITFLTNDAMDDLYRPAEALNSEPTDTGGVCPTCKGSGYERNPNWKPGDEGHYEWTCGTCQGEPYRLSKTEEVSE